MARRDYYAILSLLVPLLIYILTLDGAIRDNGEGSSILGLQYALWSTHALSLGNNQTLGVQSVDLAYYHGSYYSAVSPGFGILSLPFASVGFALDGGHLLAFGYAPVMDELFSAVCCSLACLVVYRACLLYAPRAPSFLASLALAFGTTVWPVTTIIFPQGASILFSTLAVYFVLRSTRGVGGDRGLILGGFSLGLATFVEYAAGLFVVPLAAYLLASGAGARRVAKLIIPFFAGPAAQLAYNFTAFGNPLLFPEALKVGAGGSDILSRFDFAQVPLHALYYLESPYRGLLFFSPIAFVGFVWIIFARRSGDSMIRRDSLLFAVLFLEVLLFYSAWDGWDGGLFYGPRFLVLGLPYLMIPISILISASASKVIKLSLPGLFAVSSFIQGAGALTSAYSVSGSTRTYQPAALNMPWLMQGKLDTWWLNSLGVGGELGLVFAAALIGSIWAIFFVADRNFSMSRPPSLTPAATPDRGMSRIRRLMRQPSGNGVT